MKDRHRHRAGHVVAIAAATVDVTVFANAHVLARADATATADVTVDACATVLAPASVIATGIVPAPGNASAIVDATANDITTRRCETPCGDSRR